MIPSPRGKDMCSAALYETEFEKHQHVSAVHLLATDLDISEDNIRQQYEDELKALSEHARIRDFLSVLVMKRIKDKLISTKTKISRQV
jgi:hypothetical protein